MRFATVLLAALLAATLGVAAAAPSSLWAPATTVRTCARAATPKVAFPFSWPDVRSGRAAILWLGGAPDCGGHSSRGTTLDAVSLHSDDALSVPRTLWKGRGLTGPLAVATTTHGQIVSTFDDGSSAVYGEGDAGYQLGALASLGSHVTLTATATGYIGDADLVTVAADDGHRAIELREQRHYETSFDLSVGFPVGAGTITALAVGMDFRADSIIVWAQDDTVYARWITNTGRMYPIRRVGPTDYAPQLAAVLSDNDHAFVMWTDEPPPGAPGATTIYFEHSGLDVTFGKPKPLVTFTEPPQQRLTPGSLGLVRMAPSEGVLAAWTWVSGGNYVVSVAGATSAGALPAGTTSEPGADLRLAAFAAGPRDDAVAVIERAPRAARGWDGAQQSIEAARTIAGGPGGSELATPTVLAGPGRNGSPSVAIDPDTDRAVVAWQTTAGGVPAVAYAVRAST